MTGAENNRSLWCDVSRVAGIGWFCILVISLLVLCQPGYVLAEDQQAESVHSSTPAETAPKEGPLEKTEMARFTKPETAQAFWAKLRESGYQGGVDELRDDAGKAVYQVYVLLPRSLEADNTPSGASWDLLGTKGKYVHAALTLLGISTDNAFNTHNDRRSNVTLFLIPELWLNAPRTESAESPGGLEPRASGGVILDPYFGGLGVGYLASLYYRTDIPLNSSSSSPYGSTPGHRISGGIALAGNRFSLMVSDQLDLSYQEKEAGMVISDDSRDRYDANRFNARVIFDSKNRLILSLDFVDYRINYHNQDRISGDRHDYSLIPAVRYRITPKINLLLEYEFTDISYEDLAGLNSREHYLTGGVEWKFTEKSRGYLRAGYETKRFDRTGETYSGFSFSVRGEHRLTPKTQIGVEAYRRTTETRMVGTSYAVSTGANLSLSHMLTSRITSGIHLAYWNDAYRGTREERLSDTFVREEIYQAGITLQYAFRRWLKARAGYTYTVKDSSESDFDYRTNTVFLGLTGSF